MSMTRESMMRYLDTKYRQEMQPARVVGAVNGVVTVEVNGETQVMNYHGSDNLTPGTLIWTRPNAAGATNPLASMEYAGPRNQNGSIHETDDISHIEVNPASLTALINRVQALEDFIDDLIAGHVIEYGGVELAARRVLRFQGTGVTVVDDAIDNTTVVTIAAGGGGGSGSYNDPISYNESEGYNG